MSAPQTDAYDGEKSPLILSAQAPRRKKTGSTVHTRASPLVRHVTGKRTAPTILGAVRSTTIPFPYALFHVFSVWSREKLHSTPPEHF